MGAGKTYWGQRVAKCCGLGFIDLDHEIERCTGLSVADVFASKGEAGFREQERDILRKVCTMSEDMIVAVGGGTPCYYDNMAQMKCVGRVIYLKRTVAELCEEIAKKQDERPLLKDLTRDELEKKVSEMLREREVYYIQADEVVEELDAQRKIQELIYEIKNDYVRK